MLYCTDTYPPQVNGVSVVTALSVDGLLRRGWNCAVVAPRYPARAHRSVGHLHGDPPATNETVAVGSVPLPGYRDIRLACPAYLRVAALVRRFRPHLIHSATEFTLGRIGQMVARRYGIPLVSSYHTDFGRYAESYGAPWLRGTVSRYIARFHRRSARVYTPSHPAADELRALGIEDIEVWGRGVDIDVFHPRMRSLMLRDSWGSRDAFTFVHVGRLAAEKEVHVLLEAFARTSQLVPPGAVKLVIAGTGPAEPALRRSSPEGVQFLGILDRREALPQLYASGDAFVFASRTETLGLVVLEAMASGLPVVAAPAGGVADHLSDEENGLAYPAGDARAMAHQLVRLVVDRELCARLSRGARRTAAALGWDVELDRLDASYRSVCEGALTPRRVGMPIGITRPTVIG